MKTKNTLRAFVVMIFVLGAMAMNAQKIYVTSKTGTTVEHIVGYADKIVFTDPEGGNPNLLQNPGFELPYDGTTETPIPANFGWTTIKTADNWFQNYYNDSGLFPEGAGTLTATVTTPQRSGDAFFITGTNANGKYLKDVNDNKLTSEKKFLKGKWAIRFARNEQAGIYQILEVDENETYEYGCNIAMIRGTTASSIKDIERVKILKPNGDPLDSTDKTFGTTLIMKNNAVYFEDTNSTTDCYIIHIAGEIKIPAGLPLNGNGKVEVRFQLDQRTFAANNNAPITVIDQCYFRKKVTQ